MSTNEQHYNYERIEKAIWFMYNNAQKQPTLEDVAAHVHLSPFHFQRIFTEWAGTSPKKFLQYLNVSHAKHLLRSFDKSLFETSEALGLSGTSRLHDLFVSIEAMTPGEYKNGGNGMTINYQFYPSRFGEIMIANTPKGICKVSFCEDRDESLEDLKKEYFNADLYLKAEESHQEVLRFFEDTSSGAGNIKLHLKGTDFQLQVWQMLLKIPGGQVCSYGDVSNALGKPTAQRAVGSAIGQNPVAFLIPCHRVIQSTGKMGGYMWGLPKKTSILAWESGFNQKAV